MGVGHILFERHAGTLNLPKAHYLNQRSMEIFRQHRMEGPITKIAGNMRFISRVQWANSLGDRVRLIGDTLQALRLLAEKKIQTKHSSTDLNVRHLVIGLNWSIELYWRRLPH